MRSKSFHWLTAAAWFCLVLPIVVLGKHTNRGSPQQRFTVQFRSPPGNNRTIEEQDAFLSYLEQHGVNVTVRYRFHDVMNGMSIHLNAPLPSLTTLSTPLLLSSNNNHSNDTSFHATAADANITVATDQESKNATTATTEIHPSLFLAQTLNSCPYVHRYWPGKRYARPNVQRSPKRSAGSVVDTGLPNLQAAHTMTTVDRARLEDGLTGEGIKIGVLDTGIDYTHPALGGCFGNGCRVAYGYDLVGDHYGEANSSVDPDNDPMDQCDGHGTHVAGIIGAKDDIKGFEGVAPKATLGAWRIFGCNGDTEDDIILMAAEMAMKAGMDVINLSLGGGVSAWQEDPLAVALSNMADQGIFVAVAQGNEGRDGIERTPSPAVGDHVLAVASMDNSEKLGHVFTLSSTNNNDNDTITYEYTMSSAKEKFTTNHTTFPVMALVSNHTSNIASSGCDPILQDLTGYVVLLRRGDCDFGQKTMHAQNAGALGLLIYSQPGDSAVEIDLERYTRVHIPVGSINGNDGAKMFNYLTATTNTGNATLNTTTIEFSEQLVKINTGGLSSIFSTWGPDPELHLKPDIAGIGGSVYSTYPQNLGAYMLMSGTSMATPYLSGSIALYMQAKGQKDRSAIISALLNTAAPTEAGLNLPDLLQSPIKQGSGLVQIYDAIHNTVQMEPSKIALNDSARFQRNATLTIRNQSPDHETFKLTHLPAVSVEGFDLKSSAGPVMVPTYLSNHANVTFDPAEFELEGNQEITVTVSFEPPQKNTTEHMLFGGYIELSSTLSAISARVPYFGSLGNQRDLPILDISNEFPYIGDFYGDLMQNMTYNFTQRDILYLYVRIANPTTLFKSELINATDSSVIGQLPRVHDAWLPRNDHTSDNYNYFYQWHGGVLVPPPPSSSQGRHLIYRPVPTGRYRLRLSGLRIFGDRRIKDDWHSWESPEFNVL